MKYVSQVENKITNIFALDEGILLEFSTVHMPTFGEIMEKATYTMMEAEARKGKFRGTPRITPGFSYVSLNCQPYNEFRPLLLEGEEGGASWVNQDVREDHAGSNPLRGQGPLDGRLLQLGISVPLDRSLETEPQ